MAQQTVNRLKELLFEKESREIDELNRRIEALGAGARAERGELARRIDDLALRAGGDKEFQASVARVIDGALRDAEPTQHHELTQALAPMVRRTFRAEIGSEPVRDEIANALYPKMGDMVRRYIQSAMRDMMDTINRRLESSLTENRLILKLRSITSGRSMAELALADTQVFRVEELYLIRRGSGELVHRWSRERAPDAPSSRPGSNRDTLISGFLTAITSFAEEAFASDKSSLRALDLDDHRIYLRASPAYLLAAKCSGTAETAVERVLDQNLLQLLAAHQEIETAGAAAANGAAPSEAAREGLARQRERLLSESAQSIEERIGESERAIRRSRSSRPLKIAVGLAALVLAGWGGWTYYVTRLTSEVQRNADAAIKAIPELAGFPVRARVERGGRTIWVSGLTPSAPVRARLLADIKSFAPDAQIGEAVGILPETDVKGAIDRAAVERSVTRVAGRLEKLAPDLDRVATGLGGGPDRDAIETARQAAVRATGEIAMPEVRGDPVRLLAILHEAIRQLRGSAARLAIALGPASQPLAAAPTGELPRTAAESAEELVLAAERIGGLASSLAQAREVAAERARTATLGREIEALTRRIDGLKTGPTPAEALEAFIKANAVFFANNIDYRDPAAVNATLDAFVALANRTTGLIRVVGYTDEAGAAPRNQSLSQQRADKVQGELIARGLPRTRLVAVGRATALDLAPRTGATSASRRVEFEIGFAGEEAGSP